MYSRTTLRRLSWLRHHRCGALLAALFLFILADPAFARSTISVAFLLLGDGARHLDVHTTVEHAAPATVCRETYRGIADGHSRLVFNGRVLVRPGADQGRRACRCFRHVPSLEKTPGLSIRFAMPVHGQFI